MPAVTFLVLCSPIWKMPMSYVRVSGICNKPPNLAGEDNKLVFLSKHSWVGVRMALVALL